MNYWLTTHWPPRENEVKQDPPGVWLPNDGREKAGTELRAGDYVLIYESRSGRTEIRESVDGTTCRVKSLPGRERVIAITCALEPVQRKPGIPVATYVDGTRIHWCWQARTELVSSNGSVPRHELNRILGYKASYNLRGFGDLKSGLKLLTKTECDQLIAVFKSNASQSHLIDRALQKKHHPSVHPTGGESDAHLRLKELVASDPAGVLGEAGLTKVATEWAFPTGDRADIVLQDGFGRIIGVEIELHVGDLDIEGMLQALKYRAMLEVTHKRPTRQGRAFLVAHTISDAVKGLCQAYGVEWFTVPQQQTK